MISYMCLECLDTGNANGPKGVYTRMLQALVRRLSEECMANLRSVNCANVIFNWSN